MKQVNSLYSIIRSFGILKKAAAITDYKLGELPQDIASILIMASNDAIAGKLNRTFSSAYSHVGAAFLALANEVIDKRALKIATRQLNRSSVFRAGIPADLGQSSQELFFIALQIAVINDLWKSLIPAATTLRNALIHRATTISDDITGNRNAYNAKTRTKKLHEWVAQIDYCHASLTMYADSLLDLWGKETENNGMPRHDNEFRNACVSRISAMTGHLFRVSRETTGRIEIADALIKISTALCIQAKCLLSIIQHIRWLEDREKSRQGTKPNGTQNLSISKHLETLTMMCVQVHGNDASTVFVGKQGNFLPGFSEQTMAHYILDSFNLLTEVYHRLSDYFLKESGFIHSPGSSKLEKLIPKVKRREGSVMARTPMSKFICQPVTINQMKSDCESSTRLIVGI